MVYWGTTTSTHGSGDPVAAWDPMSEETVDSVNTPPHTIGVLWDAVRLYSSAPGSTTQGVPSSWLSNHNAGRMVVASLIHYYYLLSLKPGSTIAQESGQSYNGASVPAANVMSEQRFDYLMDACLGYVPGTNTLDSGHTHATLQWGTGFPPVVCVTIQHEPETKNVNAVWGTGSEFQAYMQRAWNRYQAALTRHGITPGSANDRIRIWWCLTQFSFNGYLASSSDPAKRTCTALSYYPGDAYCHFIGCDPYNTAGWKINGGGGAFSANQWKEFTDLTQDIVQFSKDHLNKPIILGELDTVEWNLNPLTATPSSNAGWDQRKAVAWANNAKAAILADPSRFFNINWFVGGTKEAGEGYRYDWPAWWTRPNQSSGTGANNTNDPTGRHEAWRQLMNGTRGGIAQALPSKMVVTSIVSNTAGTALTVNWAAPPAGDNVTGVNVWLRSASKSSFSNAVNGNTPLPAGTRSYTFTTDPDTGKPLVPGSTYYFEGEYVNSVGKGGWFTPLAQGNTNNTPGVNNPPAIGQVSYSAGPSGLAGDVILNVPWTDPESDPVHGEIDWGDGAITAITVPVSSTPITAEHIFKASGTFGALVGLADPSNPPVSTSVPITINLGDRVTSPWGIARMFRNFPALSMVDVFNQAMDTINDSLTTIDTRVRKSQHNLLYGLIGSTHDPVSNGGSNTTTPTALTLSAYAIQIQDSLPINSLLVGVATAVSGTGCQVGVYTIDGTTQYGVCSGVDTALQQVQGSNGAWSPISFAYNDSTNVPSPGDWVYAALWIPSGLATNPAIVTSPAGFKGYNGQLAFNGGYRAGFWSGISGGLPAQLPAFASMAVAAAAWWGLSA